MVLQLNRDVFTWCFLLVQSSNLVLQIVKKFFFSSRWYVSVRMCLRRLVPSPGPSPSSTAALHRYAGQRRSMWQWNLSLLVLTAVLWMLQNLRYHFMKFSLFFLRFCQELHVFTSTAVCFSLKASLSLVSLQRCWWCAAGSSHCGHSMQWDEYGPLLRREYLSFWNCCLYFFINVPIDLS